MKKIKQIAAVILIVVLAISFVGCSKAKNVIKNNETIFTVNGFEVKADEFVHLIMNNRASYEGGQGEAYWDANPSVGIQFMQSAEQHIIQKYAFLTWARDAGIVLTEEDYAELEEVHQSDIETAGSYEAFLNDLASSYLTEDLLLRVDEQNLTIMKLSNLVYGHDYIKVAETDVDTYIEQLNVVAAKHILIMNDEGDDFEENRLLAEDILGRIKNGEDFDILMFEYTEDTGVYEFPEGYTFGDGEMVPEFESAVHALEIGETSGIVESDYGYHIILRTDVDRHAIMDSLTESEIGRLMQIYIAQAQIEYTDEYKALTIKDIKWYGQQYVAPAANPEVTLPETDTSEGE